MANWCLLCHGSGWVRPLSRWAFKGWKAAGVPVQKEPSQCIYPREMLLNKPARPCPLCLGKGERSDDRWEIYAAATGDVSEPARAAATANHS